MADVTALHKCGLGFGGKRERKGGGLEINFQKLGPDPELEYFWAVDTSS